jgi:hypothetical protein
VNHALLWAWILAAVLGGGGLIRLWGVTHGWVSGLGLGSALLLAAFLLPGFSLGLSHQAWVAPAAVALLGLGAWGTAWRSGRPGPPPTPRPLGLGSRLFLLLLAGAAWLSTVGAMHLDPGLPFLVEHAPMASQYAACGDAASHPLGGGPSSLPARLLGVVGGDPLFSAQFLAGAFQILTLLTLFSGLRCASVYPLAALLGVGAMLAGTPASWLLTTSLEQAMSHLLGAGLLTLVLLDSGWLGGLLVAGLLLALAPLQSGAAWSLGLLAGLVPWLPAGEAPARQRWIRSLLPLLALGISLETLGIPHPGFAWSWWIVLFLPALALAWYRKMRGALLLGSGEVLVAFFGQGLGAWVLGAGCVLTVAGELLGEAWEKARPGRWGLGWESGGLRVEVPRRLVLSLLVLGLVVEGLESGETAMNRQVLLAAHKVQVDLPELLRPLSLEAWVETQGSLHGLGPQDVVLARALADRAAPALVLTAGLRTEPVLPAAVLATLARRPLSGWIRLPEGAELEPAAELIRSQIPDRLPRGERLLRWEPFVDPPSGLSPSPPELQARWKGPVAPGRVALIQLYPPPPPGQTLGYRVWRNGQPWGLFPVEGGEGGELRFPVPRTPGTYTLEFYRRPAGGPAGSGIALGGGGIEPVLSDESATLAALQARIEDFGARNSSGSLVPFSLVLRNPTDLPVDLGRFEFLCLELDGEGLSSEEARGCLQPLWTLEGYPPGLLLPRAEVRLQGFLPTPWNEGKFQARPLLVDAAGIRLSLDLQLEFQTWRRLPPAREE